MKGRISEVFESIQGEGVYLGERQLFVRFFGCNLKCGFCDTPASYYKEYEPSELFEELKRYRNRIHSISFTGGEPLLQKDFLKETLKLTNKTGYRSYLETNGTLPDELQEVIDYIDIVSMDVKLPTSTGQGGFWDQHARFLEIASKKEVILKIVICKSTQEEDFREAVKLIKKNNRFTALVLQPNSFDCDEVMDNKLEEFKSICVQEDLVTCVIPQMHKKAKIR